MTIAIRSGALQLLLAGGCLIQACGEPNAPVEPDTTPTARPPILFVHGFNGSAADFAPVLQRFRADGWVQRELVAGNYSSAVSNVSVAAVIQAQVDSIRAATGWDRIHIVSYSMGSLSSRYYLKSLGGDARVESWTSISGPNHGTSTASFCASQPCIEMRPGSDFLNQLNSGDETPGNTRYATWWSPCDELVNPQQSTILTGAQNTETACLSHAGMFTETVYLQVRAFVRP
jgi:triacylglycerol lipase